MAAIPGTPQWIELEKIGMQVLDDFLVEFNSGDAKGWTTTLHFPHVRLAGGKVQIWNTPEEYVKDNNTANLKKISGWKYTAWDWRKLVQADEDKLHIAVQFSRYTADDQKIVSFESFYIITKNEQGWGVQFRSSYAGVITGNSAF